MEISFHLTQVDNSKGDKMKRVFLILSALAVSAFGYNYSGTWVNKSTSKYNDPVILKINGTTVSPYIKRGNQRIKLKSKNATNTGNGLYEAWGFGVKNLVLYIKPINSTKIKIYEKKINTSNRTVITRSFIFAKKMGVTKSIKKRYIGNWRSTGAFSAISKLTVRNVDGNLYIRAWKNTPRGQKALGLARAKYYGNALHITWYKGNLVVNATIKGLNYNSNTNRYRTLQLDLRAKNINTGLTNRQTINFRRGKINIGRPIYREDRPIRKHLKIGPVDVNLLINSY